MEIKQVSLNDLKYFEISFQYGGIFHSAEWLSLFDDKIKVYSILDQDKIIGGFFLYEVRKAFIKHLKVPNFTPSICIFSITDIKNYSRVVSFKKKIHEVVSAFLDLKQYSIITLSLTINDTDVQPYIWHKFKVIPTYTYLIDLKQSENDIKLRMTPERRNDLNRVDRDGITIKRGNDNKIIFDIVKGTFNRKEKHFNDKLLSKILFEFANDQNSFSFVAWNNDLPIAATFCVFDLNTCYYLLGGFSNETKHSAAGTSCIWSSIKYAREKGLKIFDFEGSMLPEVEKYFRNFGGQIAPYYTINKAPILIELLLKFIKRETF